MTLEERALILDRKWPAHCVDFYRAALNGGLSFPLGRALYACNGLQNGRHRFANARIGTTKDMIKVLTPVRESTAKRWLKHWIAGNSIKSLSHGKSGRPQVLERRALQRHTHRNWSSGMKQKRYCTGIKCQHWGQIPEAFDESIHFLECPEDRQPMGPVPSHPHEAGYRSGTQVTPILRLISEQP